MSSPVVTTAKSILGPQYPVFEKFCTDAGINPTKRQALKWLRRKGAARHALRHEADIRGTAPNKLLGSLLTAGRVR